MKRLVSGLMFTAVLAAALCAEAPVPYLDPIKETPIFRLDTGNRMNNDELQKVFTAVTTSYLKTNKSYVLAYEVFRDRGRQNLRSSLAVTELDYGSFVIVNIRYTFCNGYFEFKLCGSPFANIVNGETVDSIDYQGVSGPALYQPINDKLQEAVYISRGYANMYKKRSNASFYLFR